MSARPQWCYVQARLQARHSGLLTELDWRTLEAAKSTDNFIDRTRASPLRRFTAPLNAAMSSHAIERLLRQAWRAYVAEIADWVPAAWRLAVLWLAVIVDLPAIDALLRGEAPAWVAVDPALADFAEAWQRATAFEHAAIAPLLPAASRDSMLAGRWHAHWRSLWQPGHSSEGLDRLVEIVRGHFGMLARAGAQQTSAPYRRDLAQKLTRLFRRHSAMPVAVFAHLALVALELERLRGNIVRRRLFGELQEAA